MSIQTNKRTKNLVSLLNDSVWPDWERKEKSELGTNTLYANFFYISNNFLKLSLSIACSVVRFSLLWCFGVAGCKSKFVCIKTLHCSLRKFLCRR